MPQRDEPAFDRLDLNAVDHAMREFEHQASERQEKMPSSANAFRSYAAQLRIVREKMLERLPEERRTYP
jgi:L-lactate utilization protein LutB